MRITYLVIPQVSYYTTEVQESITFELSPQIASFQQGLESMIERLAELDDSAEPDSAPSLTEPLLQMSLKQELALTSGRLLHKIFEILRDTPEINREQLEAVLIKLPDITIPELLPAIIDRIFQDELGLEKVKNIIGENVTFRNKFARYLIDALMISTQIPVNESTTTILKDLKISEMTVDVSPLAVILTIHNKKVFELLSKSTSIIGTFWGNLKIVFKGAKLEFPLITIKGVDSQTLAHEKSHVWHAIVKDTLKGEQSDQIERNNVGIRARWGNPISHSDAKRASEILQYKGFDFVSATHPETINLIVNYCLNEAKDELLATMNTPGRTVKAKYEMIIDPNDDTYDYLQQHLGFKPNDVAYIRVRKEYIAQLDAHTKELRDFEEAYQSETWRKRKIIMANSLAPEPIQEFPKFFSECGFETEIYHIRATTAELNEMLHSLHKIRWIKRSFRSVSTFKDAQLWNAKVVTILDRRLNRLLKHRSNHSMIIPITRIAADVAKLKIRILESREYRILSELSVLRNTHNRLARNVELLRQGMRFDLSPFDEVEGFFEFQLNLLVQTIENMSDFAKIEDQIQDLQESIRFTYKDYQAILDMYTKEVQVLIDEIYSSVERHKKYFRMHKRTQSSSQDESSTSYQLFKKHEGELNQILDDFERRNNGKAIINLRPEFERLVEQLRSLQTSLNNAELR